MSAADTRWARFDRNGRLLAPESTAPAMFYACPRSTVAALEALFETPIEAILGSLDNWPDRQAHFEAGLVAVGWPAPEGILYWRSFMLDDEGGLVLEVAPPAAFPPECALCVCDCAACDREPPPCEWGGCDECGCDQEASE